jgi:UDP-N-acetylmuramoyl-L-alanyl-D-glutamate--2,6-diaminopimelate ligase
VPTPQRDYTVLIDYAHTPDALENVLAAVRGFAAGRVIAVFGCGGDRDRAKRPLMGAIAARLADVAVVTTDNPRSEEPMAIIREIVAGMDNAEAVVIEDRRAAVRWALEHGAPGDVIVLCGKGHEPYQEVRGQRHRLDEREIVAEYLKEL